MRQFFIFLLLTLHSFMQFAQSDSLHQSAWKALHEWEIGDDEIWTTDVLGNVLLTKKNLIQKYDSAGVLKYSQSIRSFGRLQDIQAVNSMKIVAFSEEQQTICLLDNTLTLSENCLELADFNIGNASVFSVSSQPDKIWMLDQLNSRLLLLSLGKTNQFQEISNLKGILDLDHIDQLTEYNNRLYLIDRTKGIYEFDLYGTLLNVISAEGFTNVFFAKENAFLLTIDQLKVINLESLKTTEIPLPVKDVKQFQIIESTFYFRSPNKIYNYLLSFPE